MKRGIIIVRVLVVENDPGAAEAIVDGLRRLGHDVDAVGTGSAALETYHLADFVLLNLELPDLDGLDVCRGIRDGSDTPIIAFIERGTELDRVLGLQAGSDDCMAKPFAFRELAARIDAIMRRARPRTPLRAVISHGPLRIDCGVREVRVHERLINVTRKEFDLLQILASQPDQIVSREQLMSQVWEGEWVQSYRPARMSRTIDTHVNSLRNKLGASEWIVTIRGIGFRLGRP